MHFHVLRRCCLGNTGSVFRLQVSYTKPWDFPEPLQHTIPFYQIALYVFLLSDNALRFPEPFKNSIPFYQITLYVLLLSDNALRFPEPLTNTIPFYQIANSSEVQRLKEGAQVNPIAWKPCRSKPVCRIRGPDGARRDGLNFPVERYNSILDLIMSKPVVTVIQELRQNGVQTNPINPDKALK